MIAQNLLAAVVGLAVGVKAGPCKPSSVTTTTGTASSDVVSITSIATSVEFTTADVTSVTSIATSGEPTTTTTEAATTTTSPGEYVCLKDPAPVGKGCNAQGGGQGALELLGNVNTLTLASCYKSCLDRTGCIAISLQPGSWCALWAGSFTGTSGGESAWSWYDMGCFCDEFSATTSGLATGTTASEATDSEQTTTSIELTSTTETAPATTTEATTTEATTTKAMTTTEASTTTTTAPGESCVNNERSPAPSDKICNKSGYSHGSSMEFLDSPTGVTTMEACRAACRETSGCAFFAIIPGEYCSIYSGDIASVSDQTDYFWYDMDCFCDLDGPDY
ncbi:uncharacterized protein FSUBG_10685 [Fusarium subglutinans]|uniref:Apple domain-containing protein n=1 Tax=Gibberella subglutinans TaxID=42677 RepID=A0A8H5LGL2_GIBSU|nr:uncharacterized protein FSUBG_10685 [Fusarium subglutinans]KAF5590821.1 hypothetical protein FSUBG_10685 [Fusarium subglutinans]